MLNLLQPVTEICVKKKTMHLLQLQKLRCYPKHVTKKNPDDKLPSVVTDARRDTLAKETKNKKGINDSQPREKHNVLTQHPKGPSCSLQEDKM